MFSEGNSEKAQLGKMHVKNAVQNSNASNIGFVHSGDDGPETTEVHRYWQLEQSASQIQDVQWSKTEERMVGTYDVYKT